ncbi:MAG: hypothetical protein Q8O56_14180 [Solirubrobacteraceae bacterium]|nr:hypothetical protein [Solirubrobacteraceae bacterium]
MRWILLTACLLAGLALAGCGGGDDDDDERADRPCLPAGAAFEAAARGHVDTIVVGTTAVDGDAERIEVDPCRMSDDDGTATVTVFGVRDDSIQDQRHEVTLERRDGTWTVVRDLDTHRCREGRGHRDFSTLPCS